MHAKKSFFIAATFLVAAILMGCKSPGVQYLTDKPASFEIQDMYQPVFLVVTDKSGSEVPAKPDAKQEIEKVEYNAQMSIYQDPDLKIHGIVRDILQANGAKLAQDSTNAVPFEIVIQEYKISREDAKWHARVKLQAISPEYEQEIVSTFSRPDLLGTRDAEKAMSKALTAAIDNIKWGQLFP